MQQLFLDYEGLEHLVEAHLLTDNTTVTRDASGKIKLATAQSVWYGHQQDWNNLSPSEKAKYGIVIFDDDGTTITIDNALSTTSENPVQNKVITIALNNKQPKTLDTPLTLGGTQYTTVESFLGKVKDVVQATAYWNGGA
jgi:hypothetical protein